MATRHVLPREYPLPAFTQQASGPRGGSRSNTETRGLCQAPQAIGGGDLPAQNHYQYRNLVERSRSGWGGCRGLGRRALFEKCILRTSAGQPHPNANMGRLLVFRFPVKCRISMSGHVVSPTPGESSWCAKAPANAGMHPVWGCRGARSPTAFNDARSKRPLGTIITRAFSVDWGAAARFFILRPWGESEGPPSRQADNKNIQGEDKAHDQGRLQNTIDFAGGPLPPWLRAGTAARRWAAFTCFFVSICFRWPRKPPSENPVFPPFPDGALYGPPRAQDQVRGRKQPPAVAPFN